MQGSKIGVVEPGELARRPSLMGRDALDAGFAGGALCTSMSVPVPN